MRHKSNLPSELRRYLTDADVSDDPAVLDNYGHDETPNLSADPGAVVFPRSIEQVQKIVRFANETATPLVPSGGRSGLSGGANAVAGELIVSFDRMSEILDFSSGDRSVRLQPGVVTGQLQSFVSQKGLYFPIDFASRDSSHIGGNIATNAGGIKVIRYGMTRDWVTGLKVVTGEGELLDLNRGLHKNATGYDLRHLFIGSEGTLGFIVEATLRLARRPGPSQVLLLAVPELLAVVSILTVFQDRFDLNAFEFFSELALQHVLKAKSLPHPFDKSTPFYALIDLECDSDSELSRISELYEFCLKRGWTAGNVASTTEAQVRQLWIYREAISESIRPYNPHKNDISVIVSKLPAFLEELDSLLAREYPTLDFVWFGHIGDGNLHLNVLKPSALSTEEFHQKCKGVDATVFSTVRRYSGSVSAEHGVGLLKKDVLAYTRSQAEITYMREVKAIFDPNGIMNPGKIFD